MLSRKLTFRFWFLILIQVKHLARMKIVRHIPLTAVFLWLHQQSCSLTSSMCLTNVGFLPNCINLIPFSNHQQCTREQITQIKSNNSARLLWQKRYHLVGRQICQGHTIWKPQILGKTPLLLTIPPVGFVDFGKLFPPPHCFAPVFVFALSLFFRNPFIVSGLIK